MRLDLAAAQGILCAALGAAGGADAASEPTLAACDAAATTAVLEPSAAIDARAHWLDRQQIQWPGVAADATFRLYFSARGTIVAAPGSRVSGADGSLQLSVARGEASAPLRLRFRFVGEGAHLVLAPADRARLIELHRHQLVLARESVTGEVQDATALQIAGALDDLYLDADQTELGATPQAGTTRFKLWAPTARRVWLCSYDSGSSPARSVDAMRFDPRTGVWSHTRRGAGSGRYYSYWVEVFVRGVGIVRNRVTDPYSLSLTTDSRRSFLADLNTPALKPAGWDAGARRGRVVATTDVVIYELHVRDFSIGDASVSARNRGKYLAFTEGRSLGMQHLRRLAQAGMTDVHLLPVFDLASVPEQGCTTPAVPVAPADSDAQQAAVMKRAATDCFNWGYDPFHFNAPEGSYASDAADGAVRVREFRAMVQALHRAGLRVGMDMVYNHTVASGQDPKSVLDRIVPGYYHRLDAKGVVERSTCCDNTATEHRMMAKLMIDSAVVWARDYKIDSMRFDLMCHQPREAMERLQRAVNAAAGRPSHLIGEGWNFGEVANNARFRQASQLELNGSGIGTFSDRARDFVRGGGPMDGGDDLVRNQGYINGLFYDPNAMGGGKTKGDLLRANDMIKVGLAGSIRSYVMKTSWDATIPLQDVDYNGQPAGYVTSPSEVVNYVENHDNQTLFDINAYKLPTSTSKEDRARVQILGAAINVFSQGVPYFHAGIDTLRSKSMDRNSYNSGDWFNRLDWTYADNHFGAGVPPQDDNGSNWGLIKPLLGNAAIKPGQTEITWTRDAFRDLLKIRSSSTLLRLRTADDIKARLTFYNGGSMMEPTVLVGHVEGVGYSGAAYKELAYFVNVDKNAKTVTIDPLKGKSFVLHPVHSAADAADQRPAASAQYVAASGAFTIPARTALVYVVK